MSTHFAFGPDDIIRNVIKTNPGVEFYIYQGQKFHNNYPQMSGAFTGSVLNVPPGNISLYEYNVDRNDQPTARAGGTGFIRPFIIKDGSLTSLKTISQEVFTEAQYGEKLEGNYTLSSSISREYYSANHEEESFPEEVGGPTVGRFNRVLALKNTLNYYSYLSPHYNFVETGKLQWDKGLQAVNLISIPSIFYGTSIKKGTVELDFYISGTLAARVKDINKNGELIQISGSANSLGSAFGSASVAGVVLYDEGFIVLTGSWALGAYTGRYTGGPSISPSWLYYGVGAETASLGYDLPSSSFGLRFSGSTETNVVTMFAHAVAGELNHSNNPTYIQYSQSLNPINGSTFYKEPDKLIIKNTMSGAFSDLTESFQKQTFLSKVKIYDEDMNCVGIAKLATPLNKTLDRDVTFKLKLDL
tara:strand:- start:59 stop:1306 length:1248 start_codon:yes stop_codon:yes gene_type:complete